MAGVCAQCNGELEKPNAAIFTEWLHKTVAATPEQETFDVPHAIADHSPCGCRPRRMGALAQDTSVRGWANGGSIVLKEAEPFVLVLEGNWVKHVFCGKRVGHLARASVTR